MVKYHSYSDYSEIYFGVDRLKGLTLKHGALKLLLEICFQWYGMKYSLTLLVFTDFRSNQFIIAFVSSSNYNTFIVSFCSSPKPEFRFC